MKVHFANVYIDKFSLKERETILNLTELYCAKIFHINKSELFWEKQDNSIYILSIDNCSDELWMTIIEASTLDKYLDQITGFVDGVKSSLEEAQLIAVKKDGNNIQYIENPT
jgi:hypothetical protein